MTIIRVTYSTCGNVEVLSREMVVRVCRDSSVGSYECVCPDCGDVICNQAESQIVEQLVSHGVKLLAWSMPAEMRERRQDSPINFDDALEWVLMSRDTTSSEFDDALARLIDGS